jgi:hypothetical protein
MNGGSGTGIVDFFHGFQVAIMMTLMFNLVQFIWWTCKTRRAHMGSKWKVHQPTMLVLLSAILVNIQPMAILVVGSFHFCCAECTGPVGNATVPHPNNPFNIPAGGCPSSGMTFPPWSDGKARECYSGGNLFWDKSYCAGGKYPIFPTQVSGWMVQVFCTWGGYLAMFIGVFQATQLHLKLIGKWKAIRRGQTASGTSRTLPN